MQMEDKIFGGIFFLIFKLSLKFQFKPINKKVWLKGKSHILGIYILRSI